MNNMLIISASIEILIELEAITNESLYFANINFFLYFKFFYVNLLVYKR